MMGKKALVLNMGMKSIRGIVFDQGANKLAFESYPLSTGLNADHVFQDPAEWWDKATALIKKIASQLNTDTIDYITVTASASCLVYTDASYVPLDSCIMVSDKRDAKEAENIKQLEMLGLFGDDNVAAGPMLAKMAWVKNNQPEKFKETRWFLSPNDYLIGKLTGQSVTDTFNASKYSYDPIKKQYPNKALQVLGIDPATLPKVVDVGTNIGELLPSVAAQLGLPQTVEIVVTSYDAICSFFGSGVLDEGEASDVSGTVTVMRAISYKTDLKSTSNIYITPFPKNRCNIVGGSNNLGGGLIEWGKQCFYAHEGHPYELMEEEATQSPVGAGGLLFLPYLLGERAPVWDHTVRGMYFGIERYHTRKDMVRAIFESTAYIDLNFIKSIEEAGVKITGIRVSGGLSRINLVNQIKADVTGKEIKVLREFETTASGAAMMVFEAMGVFPDNRAAVEAFCAIDRVIYPDYKNHLKYKKIFGLWQQLYQQTRDLYSARKELFADIYQEDDCVIENL